MKTRTKLAALLGAGILAFGAYGLTMAAATGESDQGVTPTTIAGNITLAGGGGNDGADCAAADGLETGNSGGSGTTTNGVTVTWTFDGTTKEFGFTATGGLVTIAYVKGGDAYNEYDYLGDLGHGVASDGNMFAPDNGSDGPAGLSHAVFCTSPSEEESQPPSEVPSAPPSEAPSAPPSFVSSELPATDLPSEPNTATVPTSGNSGPSDSSWLLVAALGVLLASVVVMTPARAKNRR
ncbi:MAG TPA: hypothetical protein VF494_10325 [Candidatus Limnocylindrales bacterium]